MTFTFSISPGRIRNSVPGTSMQPVSRSNFTLWRIDPVGRADLAAGGHQCCLALQESVGSGRGQPTAAVHQREHSIEQGERSPGSLLGGIGSDNKDEKLIALLGQQGITVSSQPAQGGNNSIPGTASPTSDKKGK